ncbi:MAG: YolD-like family protein [Bacilli bacterium]|nr:YolD-like family protein [Bacilli bacterium]
MSDRGMKKWNAYKTLEDHMPAVEKTVQNRYKVNKPLISSEEADEINYHLVNYAGEEVIITYYRDNEIKEITTIIKKISPENRELILPDRSKIKFNELLGIKDSK